MLEKSGYFTDVIRSSKPKPAEVSNSFSISFTRSSLLPTNLLGNANKYVLVATVCSVLPSTTIYGNFFSNAVQISHVCVFAKGTYGANSHTAVGVKH